MYTKYLLPSLLFFTSAAFGAGGLKYPPFTGKSAVGSVAFDLTDESRNDPLASGPQRKRRLMVELFYPTTSDASVKFPPAGMGSDASMALFESFVKAPAGAFKTVDTGVSKGSPINYNAASSAVSRVKKGTAGCVASYSSSEKLPLVMFDPGLNGVRIAYTHIAADLASHGYIVAAVDHPFDAYFLEYPDGEVVTINPRFDALNSSSDIQKDLNAGAAMIQDVRAADMEFIMSTLLSNDFTVPGLNTKLNIDTDKLGMFGHSLGGSLSAAMMLKNKNIKCGIDMDGAFFGVTPPTARDTDLGRPFMVMLATERSSIEDPTLGMYLDVKKAVKPVIAHLNGTQHLAFSDAPILADMFNIDRETMGPMGAFNPGTISGNRANAVNSAYVSAFFNKNLKGQDNGLLSKKTDPAFPEVETVDRI